jgi:photosystem II stability/assembly factor-like uncharacterized protein
MYYFSTIGKVLITSTGGIASTSDSLNFNQQYDPVSTIAIEYSVSQQRLVSVGNNQSIMTSTNSGTTWDVIYSTTGSAVPTFNDIAYSPSLNLFVAVNSAAGIWTSSDGSSWTQQIYTNPMIGNSPASTFNSIIWSSQANRFVAVGAAGTIATSDGINWVDRSTSTGLTLRQVAYNTSKSLFVVVGDQGILLTSPDGDNWTNHYTGDGTGTNLSCIAVASLEDKGFLASSATRRIYSDNGFTGWYPMDSAGVTLTGKMFRSDVDKGVFQFTDATSTRPEGLYFTDDGLNGQFIAISTQTFPITYTGLAYDSTNDAYVAVGSNSTYGSFITRLPRSYNKATQFVLPQIYQSFVRAL